MDDYITSMPRTAQERKGKIRTFTGMYVNPLSMRPEDIDIRDIAHHLANLCRYTGACPEHYSVGQHSVLVSLYFDTPRMQLAGLLHDGAEAYLNDLASPVKHDPRMSWYRELDHDLTGMVYERFGLSRDLLPLTKPADDKVFNREVQSWWGLATVPRDVVPWQPKFTEETFLRFFSIYSTQLEEGACQ